MRTKLSAAVIGLGVLGVFPLATGSAEFPSAASPSSPGEAAGPSRAVRGTTGLST